MSSHTPGKVKVVLNGAENQAFLVVRNGRGIVAEVWGTGEDSVATKEANAARLETIWNDYDGMVEKLRAFELQVKTLEVAVASAKATCGILYQALDDASSVVDKSDDEDFAYQAELEVGASELGITRNDKVDLSQIAPQAQRASAERCT